MSRLAFAGYSRMSLEALRDERARASLWVDKSKETLAALEEAIAAKEAVRAGDDFEDGTFVMVTWKASQGSPSRAVFEKRKGEWLNYLGESVGVEFVFRELPRRDTEYWLLTGMEALDPEPYRPAQRQENPAEEIRQQMLADAGEPTCRVCGCQRPAHLPDGTCTSPGFFGKWTPTPTPDADWIFNDD